MINDLKKQHFKYNILYYQGHFCFCFRCFFFLAFPFLVLLWLLLLLMLVTVEDEVDKADESDWLWFSGIFWSEEVPCGCNCFGCCCCCIFQRTSCTWSRRSLRCFTSAEIPQYLCLPSFWWRFKHPREQYEMVYKGKHNCLRCLWMNEWITTTKRMWITSHWQRYKVGFSCCEKRWRICLSHIGQCVPMTSSHMSVINAVLLMEWAGQEQTNP